MTAAAAEGDRAIEYPTLNSPTLAHGSSGVESGGGFGPLIILAVISVVVLVLLGEKKWRRHKSGHGGK